MNKGILKIFEFIESFELHSVLNGLEHTLPETSHSFGFLFLSLDV
jgi:hypothetical protein